MIDFNHVAIAPIEALIGKFYHTISSGINRRTDVCAKVDPYMQMGLFEDGVDTIAKDI